jgi:hypothetical protein
MLWKIIQVLQDKIITWFSLLTGWGSISSVKMLLKSIVFSACRLKYSPGPFAKFAVLVGTYAASDKNENPGLSISEETIVF